MILAIAVAPGLLAMHCNGAKSGYYFAEVQPLAQFVNLIVGQRIEFAAIRGNLAYVAVHSAQIQVALPVSQGS
jgi:hypothetical protein